MFDYGVSWCTLRSSTKANLEMRQERIAAVNEEVPENRRVTLRIGLHVVEVMVRKGDLHGDGVNIAARMQPRD